MRPAPHVTVDVVEPGGTLRLGSVSIDEPPGSLSSDEASGRKLYLFGWLHNQLGVYESVAGVDRETDAVRAISSVGMRRISTLETPCILTIWRNQKASTLRFAVHGLW